MLTTGGLVLAFLSSANSQAQEAHVPPGFINCQMLAPQVVRSGDTPARQDGFREVILRLSAMRGDDNSYHVYVSPPRNESFLRIGGSVANMGHCNTPLGPMIEYSVVFDDEGIARVILHTSQEGSNVILKVRSHHSNEPNKLVPQHWQGEEEVHFELPLSEMNVKSSSQFDLTFSHLFTCMLCRACRIYTPLFW